MSNGPLTLAGDGLRVAIRVTPRAKADCLVSIAAAAGGSRVLKATVTAPPEAGSANEALLRLLARALRLPRRDLSIVTGSTSRNKVVRVAGDARHLIEKVASEISRLPGW